MATPPDTRPHIPEIADEHTMLAAFLDFHRATLRWKCAGLTDEQLRTRSVEPSSLSLGLVRHMTEVGVVCAQSAGWRWKTFVTWPSVAA